MSKFLQRYGWSVIGYTGIALIGTGAYLIDVALALVSVGLLLFALALVGALRGGVRG